MENLSKHTKTYDTIWEELDISNDFIFGKVMQNPELCKELIQRILPDVVIDHIECPEIQKSIRPDVNAKSVRFDLYVQDEANTVYDIEMQVADTKELPKRTRYYQSMIDLQLIDKGQTYKQLNQSYIIFICPFDPFGKGRHIYTFKNFCEEDKRISLNDATAKIFLNTDSRIDDIDQKLKVFLDYVAEGQPSDDSFIIQLHKAVQEAKKNREWRHEFMTLQMRDQENIEKGIQQGIQQTMTNMIQNALESTKSIKQTSFILKLDEKQVRKVAEDMAISVSD